MAVVRPDGSPDSGAALDLQAVGGSFGPALHEGNGVYVLPFVPDRAAGVVLTEISPLLPPTRASTSWLKSRWRSLWLAAMISLTLAKRTMSDCVRSFLLASVL